MLNQILDYFDNELLSTLQVWFYVVLYSVIIISCAYMYAKIGTYLGYFPL